MLNLFVSVAQFLDQQREELWGVLEMFVLLNKVFQFIGPGELVEMVPDALSKILNLTPELYLNVVGNGLIQYFKKDLLIVDAFHDYR